MRRVLAGLVAAFALTTVPSPQAAQEKIRIAIWEFNNSTEQRWWFSSQLGDAARNQIDQAFSDNPELARRFSIIERDKLALVMKEQGLAAGGAIDPQTAAKVGKILGVRYIVTGGVDKFAINTTRARVGSVGVVALTARRVGGGRRPPSTARCRPGRARRRATRSSCPRRTSVRRRRCRPRRCASCRAPAWP